MTQDTPSILKDGTVELTDEERAAQAEKERYIDFLSIVSETGKVDTAAKACGYLNEEDVVNLHKEDAQKDISQAKAKYEVELQKMAYKTPAAAQKIMLGRTAEENDSVAIRHEKIFLDICDNFKDYALNKLPAAQRIEDWETYTRSGALDVSHTS